MLAALINMQFVCCKQGASIPDKADIVDDIPVACPTYWLVRLVQTEDPVEFVGWR